MAGTWSVFNEWRWWIEEKGEYTAIPLLGICPEEIIKAVHKDLIIKRTLKMDHGHIFLLKNGDAFCHLPA